MVADYSQIEVRVGGILAEEPAFQEMFERGHDVHAATAALMLGMEYDEVFDTEKGEVYPQYKHARSAAKEITFGIQYGMGDRTLAKKLGLTLREARREKRKWEESFPKVGAWRQQSAQGGVVIRRWRYRAAVRSSWINAQHLRCVSIIRFKVQPQT